MTAAAPDALREQRRRRAAVAARLVERAPDLAAALDWDTLDRAPGWLALDPGALALLQRRAGALLCADELRLAIDRTRIAAARAAVGDAFWPLLLAQRELPAAAGPCTPPRLGNAPLADALQDIGARLLVASLAQPLRDGAARLLGAADEALPIDTETARRLVLAAQMLGHGRGPAH